MKKPAIANKDEKRSIPNETVVADVQTPFNEGKPDNQTIDLKTEERNEMELASTELSKSLLNKQTEAEKNESEIAAPTQTENAYPLKINRRNNSMGQKKAAANVNFHELTVWTIIITVLLPPLGVALILGIGTEFWICLLLTLLFYFPGLIYALIILL